MNNFPPINRLAQLERKLLTYALAGGTVLAGGSVAQAGSDIVYGTPQDGPVVVKNSYYDLDLNADGIIDFTFYHYSNTSWQGEGGYYYSNYGYQVAYLGARKGNMFEGTYGSGI